MGRRAASCFPMVVLLVLPRLAEAQVPSGGEFQVHTETTGWQSEPSADVDPDARLVVSWSRSSYGPYRVDARRFDAAGTPVGLAFPVTGTGFISNLKSRVASSIGGNFVVVTSNGNYHPAGNSTVVGQAFTSDGVRVGAEFQTHAAPRPGGRTWMASTGGGFMVAWRKGHFPGTKDLWGQRFDHLGGTVGAEFRISTYPPSYQDRPAIAAAPNGQYIVVWENRSQDGDGLGVFAQRLDAAGGPLGAEFRVNDISLSDQPRLRLPLRNMRFVVVWQSAGNLDGSGSSIKGKRFARRRLAAGRRIPGQHLHPVGPERPAVATDRAGNFIVTWNSFGQDGSAGGIFAQRFSVGRSTAGRRVPRQYLHNRLPAAERRGHGSPSATSSIVWTSSMARTETATASSRQRYGGLYTGRPWTVDTRATGCWSPARPSTSRPSWYNLNGAAQTFGGSLVRSSRAPPARRTPSRTRTRATGRSPTAASERARTATPCPCPSPARPRHAPGRRALRVDRPRRARAAGGWPLHVGRQLHRRARPRARSIAFIETLLHRGVTGGCSGGGLLSPAPRPPAEQMAVFVLVAKEGAGYGPPACGTPVFADVPAASPSAAGSRSWRAGAWSAAAAAAITARRRR